MISDNDTRRWSRFALTCTTTVGWALMCAVLWGGAPALAAAQEPAPAFVPNGVEVAPGSGDRQTIGPGKVRLVMTPAGRILSLVPVWGNAKSIILGGGFAVVARGADGQLQEIANTTAGDLRVRENAHGLPVCCEGVRGGFRAPSLEPDDDRDGRVDEDRLDGIDNDGDGRVDEDFAAIGDAMIVTEFERPGNADGARLVFHAELYAWSLPHIDTAIMMNLRVRNDGDLPVRALHVVAFVDVAGPVSYTAREIPVVATAGEAPSIVQAWTCATGDGACIALVALREDRGDTPWLGGHAHMELLPAVRSLLGAAGSNRGLGSRPGEIVRARVREEARIEGEVRVFAMSPPVESLEAGQEMSVDFALVTVEPKASVDAMVATTFRTYRGDGTSRYLPPPIALRPRVLWGTYRPVKGDEPAVSIEFEQLGKKPLSAKMVSFFTGVDPALVEMNETPSGGLSAVVRGKVAKGILESRGRATLKGRLRTGEFFEAVLRPAGLDGASRAEMEAQRFWKTPGKLAPELLNGSPNPFRNSTTVFYEIPASLEDDDGTRVEFNGPFDTSVKIYNVTGQLVSVLVDGQEYPGAHSIQWGAVDDTGNRVASGVYYIKLQVEKRFITKRLILLK